MIIRRHHPRRSRDRTQRHFWSGCGQFRPVDEHQVPPPPPGSFYCTEQSEPGAEYQELLAAGAMQGKPGNTAAAVQTAGKSKIAATTPGKTARSAAKITMAEKANKLAESRAAGAPSPARALHSQRKAASNGAAGAKSPAATQRTPPRSKSVLKQRAQKMQEMRGSKGRRTPAT